MIGTIRVGDIIGFRTFNSVIRYGEVVGLLMRGEAGRPTRRDEVSVRLKPDGHVVMVQRWRIAERYDYRKLNKAARQPRTGAVITTPRVKA
ncbi:MAG TPA: hypothetical protein VJH03_23630 [Blastocatellia bacterium]|nr:hypothetical protein [Blastocatellia bacterium]